MDSAGDRLDAKIRGWDWVADERRRVIAEIRAEREADPS